MKPMSCPQCGSMNDRSSGMSNDDRPSEGDIAICIHCACIMIYQKNGLRRITDDELAKVGINQYLQITAAVIAVRATIQQNLDKGRTLH